MKINLPIKLNTDHKGFTLMEVMVSVSIFAIIITIGIGSLLTIYSTLQKTRADQQTMDSLSYVLDTMTRRVRTGTAYVTDGQSINFIDQIDNGVGGNSITYSMQTDQNGTKRLYVTEADGQQYDITPENMVIDTFNVNVMGGLTGVDGGQPMVEFQLQGTIKNGKQITPLAIQATVSQRPFEDTNSLSGNIKPTTGNSVTSFSGPRTLIEGGIRRSETPIAADATLDTAQTPVVDSVISNTGTAKALKVRGVQ